MRSLFRSFYTHLVAGFSSLRAFIIQHRRWTPIVLVSVACLIVPAATQANWLFDNTAVPALQLIVTIIAWVVEMLGSLFVYLVDIFLGFAQYNDFGNALPVKLGWVIVRDICNMFFIVVLLISAFSTILGWETSLRYNSVLPKLLLMAVLINFSRTIVQVLIDFSQVVMLTFVNAFRNAGAGNFVNAFRINDLMSMSENLSSADTQNAFDRAEDANYDLAAQVFASFLLALVLIIIANGVMLIMIAYILARIIGLWMILIFSPAAFFVTALPGKLQSGLSSFAGKYWSRLGGMLTGGPVVMFCIYLTFAILQAPPPTPTTPPPAATPSATNAAPAQQVLGGGGNNLSGQLGLRTATNGANPQASTFLTRVGTADNVASFIVAVALMLMALEAAVEAANAVDSSVGKFASKVGSASKGLAFGAAALAASAPWLAARMGYRTVDKHLYDVTGKASQLGLGLANKIPILGQLARKPLMAGMTMRRNEAAKEAQELMAATKGMTTDQKRTVQGGLRSVIGSTLGNLSDQVLGEGVRKKVNGVWMSRGEQQAAALLAQDLASDATMGEDKRNTENAIEASLQGDARFARLGPRGRERLASYMAADANLQNRRGQLDEMENQAKRINDHAMLDYVKAERKKDPRLVSSEAKLDDSIKRSVVDEPSRSKELAADVVADTGFLSRALIQAGLAKVNGNGVAQAINDPAKLEAMLKNLKPHNETLARNMEHWYQDISHNTAANGDRGMEFSRAQRGKIETDENGNTKTYISPEVGRDLSAHIASMLSPLTGKPIFGQADPRGTLFGTRDVDRIAAEVEGGMVLRNTDQANALNQLTGLSQKVTLTPTEQATDADAMRGYFDAGGSLADLSELKGFNRSVQNYAKNLADQLQAAGALTYDPARQDLGVNSAGQDRYQEVTKLIRPLAQQVGGRGISQDMAKAVLDGLSKATITVAGAPNGGAVRLGDLGGSRGTFGSMNSAATKKAYVQLYSTAQALKHTDTLERVQEKRQGSREVRTSIPSPIDRTFDEGAETTI